jgi:RimJ/RimL family protein N-acetyltransferase
MRLEGKRIYLRPLTKRDAKAVANLANDKSISRYTRVPHPYKLKDALWFVKDSQKKRKNKTDHQLGIFLKDTREFIGTCGLHRISKKDKDCEMGYWIGKPFRKKGYATEAARLLIGYGFSKLNLYRIEISHAPGNKGSERIIKNKLKAKFEGVLRKSIINGLGNRVDRIVYSILKPEYSSVKKKWH